MQEPFLSGLRLVRFEALQAVLVPRSKSFTPDQREASRAMINTLLASQPEVNRRKLALFLTIIDILAFVIGFRPFRALPEAKQEGLLTWLFDAPIGLLRKGFWGLNTLAKLGVYGQPSFYPEIGYQVRENPPDEPVEDSYG